MSFSSLIYLIAIVTKQLKIKHFLALYIFYEMRPKYCIHLYYSPRQKNCISYFIVTHNDWTIIDDFETFNPKYRDSKHMAHYLTFLIIDLTAGFVETFAMRLRKYLGFVHLHNLIPPEGYRYHHIDWLVVW